jgi:DnaJ-class molecular chaperone
MTNYYETLGVPENADDSQIKKAYRSLSLKYHPDRNQDQDTTQKMKEINEAYDILGDRDKRKEHDMKKNMSTSPFGGQDMPFDDLNNIFNMFFNESMGNPHKMNINMNGRGFGNVHAFHNGRPVNVNSNFSFRRPENIERTLNLTLEQCYHGANYPMEIERWVLDNGVKKLEKETIYITVPRGIDNNEMLLFKGKGNVFEDQFKSDLKIIIKTTNNTTFKREGLDLIYVKELSLKEALCGFSFEIDHLNGKKLGLNTLTTPSVIKPGTKKIVNNLGMVRENITGNLVLDFQILFPETLSEEQMKNISDSL